MAEFAGAFAASHAPLIAREWDRLPAAASERLSAAYLALGREMARARADIIIEIAPDHWTNFFIDNLPSVCIGVGAEHEGPREPFMAAFPHKTLRGDAGFGTHLLRTALERGFEPSVSHRLALDHGFCIPLWKSGLDPLPAIVPLILNALEPPMPTVARCAAWGELLAQAIASYPLDVRIGVLASGGLSHSIGEATMGDIDETFDRGCIAALASPDPHALIDYLDVELPRAGNGSHELRNWVVAQAAAGGRPFTLLDYYALPEVYVGCAWAKWSTIA